MTNGWPRNGDYPDDPVIPRQKVIAYRITDSKSRSAKIKVMLACGQHAFEFTGNWVLEGMVDFLVSDDPRAIALRQNAEFFVYPDLNPDGRYQAIHGLAFQAAQDPNVGTNLRMRGNPEIYAAGERDHNRLWETNGKFSTIDLFKATWLKDTGGEAEYFWDIHGPQQTGNWRTPRAEARTNRYAEALMQREPEVIRCGPESGFKVKVAAGPPGKLMLYAMSGQGLRVRYPYIYEPGGWTMERLFDSGRNLMLALYDAIGDRKSGAANASLLA